LEIVLALGSAEFQVFATMRTSAKAIELAAKIKAESLPITLHQLDVNSDDSVKSCFGEILKNGTIDVLVNNAGVGFGSIEEMPISDFKAIMETNFFGAVRFMQASLLSMREGQSGYIINHQLHFGSINELTSGLLFGE
jgi:NAD(P)-dependent dehydrogenase (short-subunit alcohol dehydrogenase family)